MHLHTNIPVISQQPKIDYTSEVLLLGSCFSNNIGDKFYYYKFQSLVNPFGILFHPKAIETFLWMATQQEEYTESDLFNYNERWHCFDAHSSISHQKKEILLRTLNETLALTYQKVKTASHIFITLGTAWVYRLKAMDMVVANCHKVPQKEFSKELLTVEEVEQCLLNSVHLIKSLNPAATIIYTVSPVRHTKDGFIENNQSKSHLISAIHKIRSATDKVGYFPSYELVMDELRDYRFYDRDMIHPNELAIDYIWEYFVKTWISQETLSIMDKVQEIQKGIVHRPFNPDSEQHRTFLDKLDTKIEQLQQQYPFIAFR